MTTPRSNHAHENATDVARLDSIMDMFGIFLASKCGSIGRRIRGRQKLHRLARKLREENAKALFDRHTMTRELVVRREPGCDTDGLNTDSFIYAMSIAARTRMSRLGDLATIRNFLQEQASR